MAIGKSGQNVRLAVKLTGWKIDVKPESVAKQLDGELFLNIEKEKNAQNDENFDIED